LITHPHPDHVAGLTPLVEAKSVPIVALRSVAQLMHTFEEPKRQQWWPVYGAEWIAKWTYPNQLLDDNDAVAFDGITYRVHDMRSGGDCDANSIWLIERQPRAAFVGDLVFNGTHSYIADGHSADWLANLERARSLLNGVEMLYPGHGAPGSFELLSNQRDYLQFYRDSVRALAEGQPRLTEIAKAELTRRLE
jgi:glyoxylase-like metal-dependent hydrolase (beta-lactamase superfamily II)